MPRKKKAPVVEQTDKLLAEGGFADDGATKDPVSGNEVPKGSLAEEVRDDVDAKLSPGEFVFPADVVRYFGLERLMKMRDQAKAGLSKMNSMGQMGNAEEAKEEGTEDEYFEEDDDFEGKIDEVAMAVGGWVPPQQRNKDMPSNPIVDVRQMPQGQQLFINNRPTQRMSNAPVTGAPAPAPAAPAPAPLPPSQDPGMGTSNPPIERPVSPIVNPPNLSTMPAGTTTNTGVDAMPNGQFDWKNAGSWFTKPENAGARDQMINGLDLPANYDFTKIMSDGNLWGKLTKLVDDKGISFATKLVGASSPVAMGLQYLYDKFTEKNPEYKLSNLFNGTFGKTKDDIWNQAEKEGRTGNTESPSDWWSDNALPSNEAEWLAETGDYRSGVDFDSIDNGVVSERDQTAAGDDWWEQSDSGMYVSPEDKPEEKADTGLEDAKEEEDKGSGGIIPIANFSVLKEMFPELVKNGRMGGTIRS